MRQVSLISTTVLVLMGFALWIPFPGILTAPSLSRLALTEPTTYLLLLGLAFIQDNTAIRVVFTLICFWTALYVASRTVTLHR